MFKDLIRCIEKTIDLNHREVSDGNPRRSSHTAGIAEGYVEVLRSMGHVVDINFDDDDGCERIWFIEIDGTTLIQSDGEIDYDGYAKLMKK